MRCWRGDPFFQSKFPSNFNAIQVFSAAKIRRPPFAWQQSDKNKNYLFFSNSIIESKPPMYSTRIPCDDRNTFHWMSKRSLSNANENKIPFSSGFVLNTCFVPSMLSSHKSKNRMSLRRKVCTSGEWILMKMHPRHIGIRYTASFVTKYIPGQYTRKYTSACIRVLYVINRSSPRNNNSIWLFPCEMMKNPWRLMNHYTHSTLHFVFVRSLCCCL